MESGDASATPRAWAALAGFEAGMAGVLVMLAVLGLASAWYRHGFWAPAAIMASTFRGDAAIGRGLSWSTLSGVALYLILYSLFGALYAAAMHGSGWSRPRLVLLGILSGAAWYYFCFGLLWRHINPLITVYTHDRPMLWGHMIYGAMLGRFPVYLSRLMPRSAPPAAMPPAAEAASPQPPLPEAPAEVPDSHLG